MNNLSILIVEDEGIIAEDLARKVRQLGYDVAGTTATGEEAVKLARQLRPSLVLMDIRLAGEMDGIEAAQEIHRQCDLPVLFLTAHSDAGTVERARQTGAFGYILKPFDNRDLRIQTEMALYKHAAERQLRVSKEQLAGINQILQAALICDTEEDLGRTCLTIAEKLTQSQFGFIGDINKDGFEDIAISDPGWDACTLLDSSGHRRPLGSFKIHGIYGRVISDGTGLFTNDPANHPDSIGLPANHPPLTSFLGVPLMREANVIGILAVANREGGYTQKDQDTLEALVPSIVEAFARKRAEEARLNSVAELQAANAKLLDSRRATLNMMQDAVIARRQAESEVVWRKEVEGKLKTLNEELEVRVEKRTQELQEMQIQYLHAEKLSAIGRLSASIAHEFNNPLQGIMATLKGLRKRAIVEEEDKELLDAAIDESVRMKNLIRSLQDFNRPSAGKKVLMDVQKSIDSLLLLSMSDFKRKRISVAVNHAERLPQILAVPDQIKQVFLNLLTNAADACIQPGGVITISTWQQENSVGVSIRDTGIGISSEKMDLIFQPFYTTKPEVKGTGLGLSICHGIVQSHQGEISVESRPGQGATFTVLLPISGT